MSRVLLATLALVALTGMSHAQQVASVKPAVALVKPAKIAPFPIYYPAKEFDLPYVKPLTIIHAKSAAEVQKACGNVPAVLGCSQRFADECIITLAPESIIIAYGWTTADVFRHEIAHCNGWHGDHRMWRRYDN